MWVAFLDHDGYKCMRINGKLEDYQKLVCGYIECVPTCIKGHLLLIDEDGKFKALKPNTLATMMAGLVGRDVIVGNAVLVRLNSAGDDWTGWNTKADCYAALTAVLHASYGAR